MPEPALQRGNRHTTRQPSALLLDLDGTLVDSEEIQRAGYRAFFAGRGWSEPDLGVFTGRRADDVFATEPGPWSGDDPAALGAEVRDLVPHDRAPTAIAGADDLVRAAHAAGIPVAIVTSARPDWVRVAIPHLLDLVEVVVTADDVVNGKPDPAGFLLALGRLGADPARALAAEDSVAGVASARAAGIGHVVGVTTSHTAAELVAAGAHATYSDLRPVATMLAPSGEVLPSHPKRSDQ